MSGRGGDHPGSLGDMPQILPRVWFKSAGRDLVNPALGTGEGQEAETSWAPPASLMLRKLVPHARMPFCRPFTGGSARSLRITTGDEHLSLLMNLIV